MPGTNIGIRLACRIVSWIRAFEVRFNDHSWLECLVAKQIWNFSPIWWSNYLHYGDSYLIEFWWSVAYSLAPRLDNWDSEFDLLFICIAVFRARQGSGIYSSGTGKELAYRCHCKAIGKLDAETFSKSQSTAPLSHGLTYVVEGFNYSFGSLAYWYPDGLSNFVNGLDWYPAGNISPE